MAGLTIVGTGLEKDTLTLRAAELLRGAERVILHTDRIGCTQWLTENGIAYESLDWLYEECPDFDEHNRLAADAVLEACEQQNVVYAVYDIRDRSVQEILSRNRQKVRVVAGPPVEGPLTAQLNGATRMVEASDWATFDLRARDNTLIRELSSRELASEVKVRLMDVYPEETRLIMTQGNACFPLMLYDLDRLKQYDHRTCVLVPKVSEMTGLENYEFEDLVDIMRFLVSPQGCPWDSVQTHKSIVSSVLEEAYEVIDAIEKDDPEAMIEELGDLLMQVVLHSEIARKHSEFEIRDVTTAIAKKMISRHSHVFGTDARDSDIDDLWQKNKMKEKEQSSYTETLRDVPRTFPALKRAQKVLKRAKKAGYPVEAIGREMALDAGSYLANHTSGEVLFALCEQLNRDETDSEIELNERVDRFIEKFAEWESRKS